MRCCGEGEGSFTTEDTEATEGDEFAPFLRALYGEEVSAAVQRREDRADQLVDANLAVEIGVERRAFAERGAAEDDAHAAHELADADDTAAALRNPGSVTLPFTTKKPFCKLKS